MNAARKAADSDPVGWLARLGLTSRGLIYVMMGVIALLVAGGKRGEVDQKGALSQVIAKPFGGAMVLAMAIGFFSYALWRITEAAFGVSGEGHKVTPRAQSFVRAIIYLVLTASAVAVVLGSRTSQRGQQRTFTARTMDHTGGRALVFVVGAAVIVIGLVLAWEGATRGFMKHFARVQLSHGTRRTIVALGTFGNVARGLVFALVGCLVVSAAWTYQPAKAGGLDVALKTLRDGRFGFLLVIAATGLMAFGVYGLLEARFRRV